MRGNIMNSNGQGISIIANNFDHGNKENYHSDFL